MAYWRRCTESPSVHRDGLLPSLVHLLDTWPQKEAERLPDGLGKSPHNRLSPRTQGNGSGLQPGSQGVNLWKVFFVEKQLEPAPSFGLSWIIPQSRAELIPNTSEEKKTTRQFTGRMQRPGCCVRIIITPGTRPFADLISSQGGFYSLHPIRSNAKTPSP